MSFLDVLREIYFKKFCKGVQGKKLFQLPEWRRSRFPYAEFTRLREIDSRAKVFPLLKFPMVTKMF